MLRILKEKIVKEYDLPSKEYDLLLQACYILQVTHEDLCKVVGEEADITVLAEDATNALRSFLDAYRDDQDERRVYDET